jgi:transcriptional regulator with PAS, ATPase and Fis domain
LLVGYFLDSYGQSSTMSVERAAAEALVAYDWPGNVRQLGRVLERAIALAPHTEITLADLPAEVRKEYGVVFSQSAGPDDSLRAWSSRYVHLVLSRCRGNKRRACDVLDISYHTLQAHLTYTPEPVGRRALTTSETDPGDVSSVCDATV